MHVLARTRARCWPTLMHLVDPVARQVVHLLLEHQGGWSGPLRLPLCALWTPERAIPMRADAQIHTQDTAALNLELLRHRKLT